MKPVALALALASTLAGAVAARSSAAAVTVRPPAGVTGRYALERPNGGCLLDVAELSGGRIRFQLFCDRGEPSHNTGSIAGTARLSGGVAVYRVEQLGGVCELRMTFRRGRMEMVQNERDGGCGFGYGVEADGRYERTRTRPSFDLAHAR
ncbi:MAG TPA: hypothetical protein VF092_28145 [Longimicrobium sp.]